MKRRSIYLELILAYLLFLALALYTKGSASPAWMDNLLSIATFTFAIILAFSTANRKQRLNAIRSTLRENDAHIFTLYTCAKTYGKEVTGRVQKLLDNWLIDQIDFYLQDFDRSSAGLYKVFEYCRDIKTAGKEDEQKKMMLTSCADLVRNQKELSYWVKDEMFFFEWLSLGILGSIIIFCLYYANDGSLLYILTVPFLAVSLILLFLVLRDINRLEWQEEKWIWNRLTELFEELDLLPYFPEGIFYLNRVNINKLKLPKKYRLAHYPDPYPIFRNKKVEVIESE